MNFRESETHPSGMNIRQINRVLFNIIMIIINPSSLSIFGTDRTSLTLYVSGIPGNNELQKKGVPIEDKGFQIFVS